MGINVITNSDGTNVLVDGTFSPWEENTDLNIQAEYGKAYILSLAASQTVTLPLPAAGSLGKGFAITGNSTSDDKSIAQNAGQQIQGVDWETTAGTGGGVRTINSQATMIIVATNDAGTQFKAYGIDGYFENNGKGEFFNSDGLANIEDGQLMIGNSFNARPQPGVISSNDGSVIVTNGNGTIDLSASGGGGGLEWAEYSDSVIALEQGKGYILTGAFTQTLTLAAVGSGQIGGSIGIINSNTNGYVLTQNTNQTVIGTDWDTVVTTGSLSPIGIGGQIIITQVDTAGFIYSTTHMSGYFSNNGKTESGETQVVYNDGIANFLDGELLIGSSVNGAPVRATLTSSNDSVTVTNGSGIIDLSAHGFYSWEEITATTLQIEYGKAYILNGASPQTVTLPAAASGSIGKSFALAGKSPQLFAIAQNAGQSIAGINWSTLTGAAESLSSLSRGCSIVLTSEFDNGNIFVPTQMSGYFSMPSQDLTVNADGLAPRENGEIIIGNGTNNYPQVGTLSSNDSSVTITNSPGGIDLSASGPTRDYGYIKLNDNGDTGYPFSFTTTPSEVIPSGGTYNTNLSGFTNPSNARLTYTGATTKTFSIRAIGYWEGEEGDPNPNLTLSIAINASEVTNSRVTGGDASRDIQTMVVEYIVDLQQNDVVSIFGFRINGSNGKTVLGLCLSITEV